jgi:REP element-mobilizing transposase RayT
MSTRRSLVVVLAHVVWATHGRRRVLPAWFDSRLRAMIEGAAMQMGCAALAVGVAPDHVHVLLRLSANVALADAAQRLKGATAHETNRQRLLEGTLRWEGHTWAESIGLTDLELLADHVRGQRRHHEALRYITERWELEVEREIEGSPLVH